MNNFKNAFKSVFKNLKSLMWLIPFVFFLVGYYSVSWFIGSEIIITPDLVGKNLNEAVSLVAPYHLNLRILDEVEEPAIVEGTILEQQPAAGQKIKIYQSLGVVVARKQQRMCAPDFLNNVIDDIRKKADKLGIRIKFYEFESVYPTDVCIGQCPQVGEELVDKIVIVYVSAGTHKLRLVPDLRGLSVAQAQQVLQTYAMQSRVIVQSNSHKAESSVTQQENTKVTSFFGTSWFVDNKQTSDIPSVSSDGQRDAMRVVAQRPVAGSFVSLDESTIIELSVA